MFLVQASESGDTRYTLPLSTESPAIPNSELCVAGFARIPRMVMSSELLRVQRRTEQGLAVSVVAASARTRAAVRSVADVSQMFL